MKQFKATRPRLQISVVEPKAFVSQLLAYLMPLPDLSVHLG